VDLCGKQVKLQIWDTAGQERFRTITTSYFRGAQGILLVYDVTDPVSFSNINNWMSQIHQHADLHVNKILIGNKCDMDEERKVSVEEGRGLAEKYKIPFFETSAKSKVNVGEAFEAIANDVTKRLIDDGSTGTDAAGRRAGDSGAALPTDDTHAESGSCC
jgi:Ras-related protein Rab-8A